MATVSLSTLRSTVRTRGDYLSSIKFTDAYVNGEINAALGELYELINGADEGYFTTTSTGATVAGQDYVNLPADLLDLKGLDVLIGSSYRELDRISIGHRNRYGSTNGEPVAFRLASGGTRGRAILYPTPDAAYTVRFVYDPSLTLLSADGDTFEFHNGWDEYVITGALVRLDGRMGRPSFAERQAELSRQAERVVKAVSRRNSSQPEPLVLHPSLDPEFL